MDLFPAGVRGSIASVMPVPGNALPAAASPTLRAGEFPETRWSMVLAAQGRSGECGEHALSELCRAYWYPIYAYVRRTGAEPPDAEDVTQGFFLMLLERDSLRTATPERGRLRSFLLTALKHYMTDARRRETTLKRGGGQTLLSIDQMRAEERLANEPVHQQSPDALYDQSWAYAVLETTMRQLREYYTSLGKAALFAEIEGYLSWHEGEHPYREAAAKLGVAEPAVRFAVHKMRQRYQSLLRRQITDTVASYEDAEEEIGYLCEVLAR